MDASVKKLAAELASVMVQDPINGEIFLGMRQNTIQSGAVYKMDRTSNFNLLSFFNLCPRETPDTNALLRPEKKVMALAEPSRIFRNSSLVLPF